MGDNLIREDDFRQLGFVQRTDEAGNNEVIIREEYYSYDDFQYPNWLLNAKYKSSLLHQRVLDLIISNVPMGSYDREGSLIVQVDSATLKRYLGAKGNGWYTSLNRAAINMTGQVIGYKNPESHEFRYFPFISKAELKSGKFTVRFVPEVAPILTKLYTYTNMNLSVNRRFESVYAKILYATLKSECYYPKTARKEERTNRFYIEKSLAELRIQLGCVNPELSEVRNVLNETGRNGQPDYEKAVKAAKGQQTYKDFCEFRTKVLDAAVDHINELQEYTKMQVRYEPIRAGRGGRVVKIGFFVTLLSSANTERLIASLSDEEKEAILDQITDLIDEKLKVSEIVAIAEAADYQLARIEKAYSVAQEQNAKIMDLSKWMINAIKKNIEPGTTRQPQPRKKNKFNDFTQRQYDYTALEIEAFGQ